MCSHRELKKQLNVNKHEDEEVLSKRYQWRPSDERNSMRNFTQDKIREADPNLERSRTTHHGVQRNGDPHVTQDGGRTTHAALAKLYVSTFLRFFVTVHYISIFFISLHISNRG